LLKKVLKTFERSRPKQLLSFLHKNMTKIALITGASSGIGYATALEFAKNGINLILCGRRTDKLKILQTEISGLVDSTLLTFDVSNKDAVNEAIESLPDSWKAIDILVNNAGNAHGLGPIQDNDPADWQAMMDSNVNGLLYVSNAVIPLLLARKAGHIVNVSSIAGKQIYGNGTVYCASKAAVEALSQGMRYDLVPHGIKVTNVAPGAVETEFSMVRFKGDEARSKAVYQGFTPLTAQDIAESIYFAVSRPAHVQVADITLFAAAQAGATNITRKTT
jgi:3-hydroxy acid dehydrogenase / malonic semialdehyde reductase